MTSACPPEQFRRWQQSVHRTGAEAFQIERHKLETKLFECSGKLSRHRGVKSSMQLFASDFNAHDVAVMPDSELPETEFAQSIFTLLHHGERFSRNRPAVFDT